MTAQPESDPFLEPACEHPSAVLVAVDVAASGTKVRRFACEDCGMRWTR